MELKKILDANSFEFKKKFGQNFITDTNLLQGICNDAELCKNDEVLEIGVGGGTLTKIIAKNSQNVVGFEIDETLKNTLSMSLQGVQNAQIVFKDFLKADNAEINSYFNKPFKVVANLPYYVTTDIIFKLISDDFNLISLTLMVQKEVADRLTSKCGTKDYGTITVELDAIADLKITRIVGRQMFMPPPNVDSAIVNIKFNRSKHNIKNFEFFQKVVRACFSMRRKTLANCLKSKLSLNNEQVQSLFEHLKLDSNIRAESLTTAQFVELSNLLYQLN